MFDFFKTKLREQGVVNARQIILPFLFLAFVIYMWQLAVDEKYFSHYVLPPPGDVVTILAAQWEFMFGHALSTLYECFLGFVFASAIALTVSSVITLSYIARRAIYPNLIIFQLIPTIALQPMSSGWLTSTP